MGQGLDTGNAMQLNEKIMTREALVGIIGMGYVGLPMAVEIARAGFRVLGVDVDEERVDSINRGSSYIDDIASEDIEPLVAQGLLGATRDFGELGQADIVLICVPTPINRAKDPDMSFVASATEQVARCQRAQQLIVLESTTYPGTTTELLQPRLEKEGMKAGTDFYLAFSPERIDPGNKRYKPGDIPKVVGGVTEKCTERAVLFYSQFIRKVVPVSSPTAAEMVKIYENIFRNINIAFVNELAMLCDRMGLDVWEIIDAASTKPYGFMAFYPGPGLGGHCIPVDPHYLAWKAKHYDFHVKFIELAASINDNMPYHVCRKVASVLNGMRKSVNGSRILVLGVTYKKDVADLRESPALRLLELLRQQGADVFYNDPYIPELILEDGALMESVPLSDRLLEDTDCVLIVSDHSGYPYEWIASQSKAVVDTRNAMKHHTFDHVVRL
ncbi:MAG: nucleotide sugar dehydrogenase [Armatimonadetes bacterium]|nr:nucleotide sugar dehydrogenase [Armatimonadota bacterium]